MRVTKNTFASGQRYRIRTSYGREYEGTYQGTGVYPRNALVFAVKTHNGRATSYPHIRPSDIIAFEEA